MEICYVPSPVGRLTLAAEAGSLIGLWLEGQRYYGDCLTPDAAEAPEALPFPQARQWLTAYFAGKAPDIGALPLAPRGTDFQRRVWQALLDIPYGRTVTYGGLARQLGSSARAVGGAVGKNPISILIPCHRVVGSGGSLTGYSGGLDNKRFLLALENDAQRSMP